MVRRSRVTLHEVASWSNLTAAFWRAAKGKRMRAEVAAFAGDLERNLGVLQREILAGAVVLGGYRRFAVHDPKLRLIHAPPFRDRVLHHALVACIGPILDRASIADSYACRTGRGPLAAVLRAQQQSRRHAWYGKVDVRRYFDSIDHAVLLALLERRFKDRGVLALCRTVVASHATAPGRGLPIGALTSQHFANAYLGPLDRYLLEELRVPAMVRYMDDVVFWCDDRIAAHATLEQTAAFVGERLRLEFKANSRVQQCWHGLPFLGFAVRPHRLRLLPRRRRRYAAARGYWERLFVAGLIDASHLQRGYDAALAITAHADTVAMRRAQLLVRPAPDV